MSYIRDLKDITSNDGLIAGGKGANLGELLRSGLPVPPGFVLLTTAYQQFVAINGLQEKILQQLQNGASGNGTLLEEDSKVIHQFFVQGIIPDEVVQVVQDAYAQLGNGSIAVRSSATAEDLPTASFAGQQESYLNVQGLDDLLIAIKNCWASLWTQRAIVYRKLHYIQDSTVALAVVVQQMVSAEASGVLFTVNPVTGHRDEIVMNAIWGLGEALVSGQVTPDEILVEKATGKIRHQTISNKHTTAASNKNRTVARHVDRLVDEEAILTAEQVAALADLGRRIEQHFASPQDIEWALARGQFFVVQARPITTQAPLQGIPIPPGDDAWDKDTLLLPQPYDLWTRSNVGENLPFPLTPLTSTNFPAFFKLDEAQPGATQTQTARRFYGRLYINEGAIVHSFTEDFGLPVSFLDRLWGSRRRGNQQASNKIRPLRLLRKLPSLLKGNGATQQKMPKQTSERFFAQIDQWVNEFHQKDLSAGKLDDRALWSELGLPAWRERGGYVFRKNLQVSMPSGIAYAMLATVVGWWAKERELAHDMVAGLDGMYNAEVGPSLWQMLTTLRGHQLEAVLLSGTSKGALRQLQSMPEAADFSAQITQFLARHGHRCPNELELLNPRWIEVPELVVEILRSYAQVGENVNPVEAERRQRQRRDETIVRVEAKLDPLRKAIFRLLLKNAQKAVTIRDNSRYYVTKFMLPIREVYALLGERWAERGWLQDTDDIFFLKVQEIERVIEAGMPGVIAENLQSVVANRRLAYNYWFHVMPSDAIDANGKPIEETQGSDGQLKGVSVSGGTVRGRARVTQSVQEAMQLVPGDILVTAATDPGWTPVFPLISGIVLEIGGQLSHGSIIAREYGIPAVVNVPGAMQIIKDGQIITVDGAKGIVYL